MKRYAVVFEKAERNWGAFSPDVPGCIATGKTLDVVRQLFKEALEFHLEGLAEDGDPIPEPTCIVEYVEVEEPQPPAAKAPTAPAKAKRRARARDAG